jgi:hypothetical protein
VKSKIFEEVRNQEKFKEEFFMICTFLEIELEKEFFKLTKHFFSNKPPKLFYKLFKSTAIEFFFIISFVNFL